MILKKVQICEVYLRDKKIMAFEFLVNTFQGIYTFIKTRSIYIIRIVQQGHVV